MTAVEASQPPGELAGYSSRRELGGAGADRAARPSFRLSNYSNPSCLRRSAMSQKSLQRLILPPSSSKIDIPLNANGLSVRGMFGRSPLWVPLTRHSAAAEVSPGNASKELEPEVGEA